VANKDALLPNAVNLKPIQTQRASEAIYDQIKDMILSGQLKPGDRLPSERNMMDMLQRSRPTIREALRMLERSGFIRTIAGSNGAIIQEPNTKGVEQSLEAMLQSSQITLEKMSEYRSLNDVAIAGWAAERRTDEDLEALDALLAHAEATVENYEDFILIDPQFHGLLAKASKNEVAYIMTQVFSKLLVNMMHTRMEPMTKPERIDMCTSILKMHKDVVEAIRAKDVNAAEDAMRYHVHAFLVDLKAMY
jgi:GntR family transcriptional repressor for pyruvate dehydrogenase complex